MYQYIKIYLKYWKVFNLFSFLLRADLIFIVNILLLIEHYMKMVLFVCCTYTLGIQPVMIPSLV